MPAPTFLDMASTDVESAVNEKGEPFCKIRCTATDGLTILVGQLPPQTLREQAMQFLEVAEAAEQDAATLRTIRNLGRTLIELRAGR